MGKRACRRLPHRARWPAARTSPPPSRGQRPDRHVGANACAAYSRAADLGNGEIIYPIEGIGATLLIVPTEISFRLGQRRRERIRSPSQLWSGVPSYGRQSRQDLTFECGPSGELQPRLPVIEPVYLEASWLTGCPIGRAWFVNCVAKTASLGFGIRG